MAKAKLVIIGAGISGLSAGIYAAKSGFDVTIVEQHTIPGGMCTSWRRNGYLFEGSMHWLTGSSPKVALNQLWRETGALSPDVKVFYPEPFASVEWEDKTIHLYRDMEKTRKHFLEIAPEDTAAINKMIKDVKNLAGMQMPITDIKGLKCEHPMKLKLGTIAAMFPAFPVMGKIAKMTCGEYLNQFKNPALKKALSFLPTEYSATALLFTLVTLTSGDGGFPEGGSIPMIQRMVKTFKGYGGSLRLGTKVDKVLTQNGSVVGVSLADETITADAVVVTQETIAAVEQLFDTPPSDTWLRELCEKTVPSLCTFVGLGIRAELKKTPTFTLDKPIICGGIPYHELHFNNYYGYKGFAPEGGTALTIPFLDDTYEFWKKAKDEGRYEQEKAALAKQISNALCQKFPQVKGNIDIIDIATPLTYERYTGAHKGSWMGLMQAGEKQVQYPGYLDSIKGVYFAGHRMMLPGGMPVALYSGRKAAQMVCKQFDVVFK